METPKRVDWTLIPSNMIEQISLNLDFLDIIHLSEVCKKWNEIIQKSQFLWKTLCEEIDPIAKEGSSWKTTFKHLLNYLGYWNFVDNHIFISQTPSHQVQIENKGSIEPKKGLRVENRQYYQIKPADIFQAHLGMTIEVWFFPTNFQYLEYENSIISMHGHGFGWELRGNAITATFLVTTSVGGHETIHFYGSQAHPVIRLNEWNHMAGVISKTGRTIFYLNDRSEARVLASTQFIHRSPHVLQFGRNIDWGSRHFTGYIGKVRIVNEELTLKEKFLVHPEIPQSQDFSPEQSRKKENFTPQKIREFYPSIKQRYFLRRRKPDENRSS